MNHSNYLYQDADYAHAWGGPAGRAQLKTNPEDFEVVELLDFEPANTGEHLWLWVEKRGINTQWLAGQIARWAGVRPLDVGFAGLKDRHGVTRQWFSVYLPHKPELKSVELEQSCLKEQESIQVLAQHWHQQKLRRGNNRGNRFRIVLRDVQANSTQLAQIIEQVRLHGVPNYFGAQRFGRQGDNVVQLLQRGFRPARQRGKGKRGGGGGEDILLSAGRSFMFNHLLSARVADGSWLTPRDGEVMMLNGSQSIFLAEQADAVIQQRHQQHDIHVTGALWGAGPGRSQGVSAAQEQAIAEQFPELAQLLCDSGLKQERRSLRLLVDQFSCDWQENDLCLSFELPSGAYATTVMRELLDCQLPA